MMEISPQHHPIMEGPNAINLKTIMAQTGAQIVFPEANDPIIPVLKKSSVTVSGNIDSVYLARQMLVVSSVRPRRRLLLITIPNDIIKS